MSIYASSGIQIIQLENDGITSRYIHSSRPSLPHANTQLLEKSYWKFSFRIVLLPLLLLGLPIHLALMKRPISTRDKWIKSLFNPRRPVILVLTIVTFTISGGLNYYVLRNLYEIFYILVIKGELNPIVVLNLIALIQNLPIVIMMNFIWIWGYVSRELILSFTRASDSDSFLQNPDIVQGNVPELDGRWKLIGMYTMIAFIHTIHLYMYTRRAKLESPDVMETAKHFLDYVIGPVFSTLMLPIYATFSWACHRHYVILTNYLQSRIKMRINPNLIDFNRFKEAYKELSDRVQLVNLIFSIYFSWVVVNVVISTWVEAYDLFILLIVVIYVPSDSANAPIPPEFVRGLVVFLFIIFLKFLLLGFTCWQPVQANDMARELNVWLNDLVTEPSATLSIDNYNAFRLLKFYVRSRMQQPLPALLRVPVAGCLPVFSSRLNPTYVDQY